MRLALRTVVGLAVVGMMSMEARAGAFSLYTESSAVEIGNFAAGSAAEAPDASIAWYNPAGLVLLDHTQGLLSGVGVFPSSEITGTSTYTTEFIPVPYVQTFQNLQGAKSALVPAVHLSKPLGHRAVVGLSIISPFGLSTNWDSESPVRYAATNTSLTTIDVSPSIGGLVTDNLSLGLGLDLEYSSVKFNQEVGSPAFFQYSLPNVPNAAFLADTSSHNQGTSFGVGFHAGAMGFLNQKHTRVGLNYQSTIQQQYRGNSYFTGFLADPLAQSPTSSFMSNTLTSNQVTMPGIWTLSAYHDLNPKFALLGSLVYTMWDSFKTIQLKNIAAYSDNLENPGPALINITTDEYYRNTWRFALGANYHVTDDWMMRVGGGYDQTPTINSERDVRLPDGDRWALSVGTHVQLKKTLAFDVGYTYLFGIGNPALNKTTALGEFSSYNVSGSAKDYAQLLGFQIVWQMDGTGSII